MKTSKKPTRSTKAVAVSDSPPSVTSPFTQKLVALPVAGDSFLLVRAKGDGPDSVLIDGGLSGQTLYRELTAELGQEPSVRRIICTHNDADHANGLAEMLQDEVNYPLRTEEIWLPGSWANALPRSLTTSPHDAIFDVAESVGYILRDSAKHTAPRSELQAFFYKWAHGWDIAAAHKRDENHSWKRERNEDPHQNESEKLNISQSLTRSLDYQVRSRALLSRSISRYANRYLGDAVRLIRDFGSEARRTTHEIEAAISVFLFLIDAEERIIKIATSAGTRQARLRWFDAQAYYDEHPASRRAKGGDDDLVPLNSFELVHPPRTTELADLLYLTTVNLHSLVFWAPETETSPGCIFSADGLLDGDKLDPKPLRKIVATAPHHGSASNAAAYPNLRDMLQYPAIGEKWRDQVIFLRSDMNKKKNPCPEYKQSIQRLCTICPNKSLGLQKVVIPISSTAHWDFKAAESIRACSCT